MTKCENKERNLEFCNCTFSCGRKGICCECVANHRAKGALPACYFPADMESSGDRSIENFISIVNERGTSYLK